MLVTLHMAAAKFLETPELQLADEEARALAVAVQRVSEQYSTQFNPKLMAWMQLAMVAGSIYGTRIYAIRARHMAALPQRDGQKVVDIKPDPKAKVVPAPGQSPGSDARTPSDLFGLHYSAAIANEMA